MKGIFSDYHFKPFLFLWPGNMVIRLLASVFFFPLNVKDSSPFCRTEKNVAQPVHRFCRFMLPMSSLWHVLSWTLGPVRPRDPFERV